MAILKDFPYNSALFGFNITTPEIRQEQDDHPKIGGNQKLMSLYCLCTEFCPGVLIFEGRIFCLAMSYQLRRPRVTIVGLGVVVGGSGGGGCRQEASIVYPLSKVWFPTCYVYPT